MTKIVLDNTAGGYNLQKINANFNKIQDALNNDVLWRDNPNTDPNNLEKDLDTNGKRIYNLPAPIDLNEAARLQDVQNAINGVTTANLITYQQAGTGAVVRTVQGRLRDFVSVKDFGATGNGTTDDTAFIQAAINYVASVGGGEVYFPPGNYKVRKDNPTNPGGTVPNDFALSIQSSNITLRGVKGASRIFADNTAPVRFVTLRIGAIPIVNGGVELEDIKVEGLEFDGNYVIPPTGTLTDDGNMLMWIHGVKRGTFRDLYLHHSSDYGIGMQNGGHVDIRLENITIEDVLADGIDIKNNGDADSGVKFDNIVVRRFGLATLLSEPFAGIDTMGPGVQLTNITVEDFGTRGTPNAGIRFKQGEVGDPRGQGANYSSLSNFYINANGPTGYVDQAGVKISAREVHVSNGEIRNCVNEGVLIEQQECTVTNVLVKDSGVGFRLQDSIYTTNGDRTVLVACSARSNTTGFQIQTDENIMSSCISRANGTNLNFTAASSSNKWMGGQIANHTVKAVGNTGSQNQVKDVTGFPTATIVESPTFLVDSTGSKSVAIPHGLSFTPTRSRAQITLLRSPNNVTYTVGRQLIISADAININAAVQITVASGTAGDTATLALMLDNSFIPAM